MLGIVMRGNHTANRYRLLSLLQQLGEIVGGERLAEVVALPFIAPLVAQKGQLLVPSALSPYALV